MLAIWWPNRISAFSMDVWWTISVFFSAKGIKIEKLLSFWVWRHQTKTENKTFKIQQTNVSGIWIQNNRLKIKPIILFGAENCNEIWQNISFLLSSNEFGKHTRITNHNQTLTVSVKWCENQIFFRRLSRKNVGTDTLNVVCRYILESPNRNPINILSAIFSSITLSVSQCIKTNQMLCTNHKAIYTVRCP